MCIRTHSCMHTHIHTHTISHVHTCTCMHAQMHTPPKVSFYESDMSNAHVLSFVTGTSLWFECIFLYLCVVIGCLCCREKPWVLTRLRKNKFCRQRRGLVACSEGMNIISGPLTLQLAIHMKSSHIVHWGVPNRNKHNLLAACNPYLTTTELAEA